MMRLSDQQKRALRWIATSSVSPALLDCAPYGNRRRTVRSLFKAGLVEADTFDSIRLTKAGLAAWHASK